MRTHGTLMQWNDERGFGFVLPSQGTAEIFVHISAFPGSDQRPQVGELISFEKEISPDGKLRAIRVMRAGERTQSVKRRHPTGSQGIGEILKTIFGLVALVAIVAVGYSKVQERTRELPVFKIDDSSIVEPTAPGGTISTVEITSTRETRPVAVSTSFQCDGRTMCSQMTSCEEARYFLRHCPNPRMDGNNDGEPCEQQWCH